MKTKTIKIKPEDVNALYLLVQRLARLSNVKESVPLCEAAFDLLETIEGRRERKIQTRIAINRARNGR